MSGMTSTGFVTRTLTEIVDALGTALRSAFGASLPLHGKSLYGQLRGIMADRFAELWEVLQALYSAHDPDTAEDAALDAVCALTGTVREGATYSTATLTCTGAPLTALAAGRVVSVTSTLSRLATTADAMITALTAWASGTAYAAGAQRTNGGHAYVCTVAGTSAGSGGPTGEGSAIVDNTATWRWMGEGTGACAVAAAAEDTGPIVATSGQIITIETPVAGWNGVVNLTDATEGSVGETDAELRVRRIDELAGGGNNSLEGLRTALLRVDDVTEVRIFENRTMETDGDGLPPKSFEALVRGGLLADIATAIFTHKPLGIETYGTTWVDVVDSQGTTHSLYYSEPVAVPIYVDIAITYDADLYPDDGDAQVEAAIVAWGDARRTGYDAVSSAIAAAAFTIPGVLDVTSCLISESASPTLPDTIAISTRQIATYDTSRITVTSGAGTP